MQMVSICALLFSLKNSVRNLLFSVSLPFMFFFSRTPSRERREGELLLIISTSLHIISMLFSVVFACFFNPSVVPVEKSTARLFSVVFANCIFFVCNVLII